MTEDHRPRVPAVRLASDIVRRAFCVSGEAVIARSAGVCRKEPQGAFFQPSVTRQWLVLFGWLLFCLLASGAGVFVGVDGWYAALIKPSWNPPVWVFGPVWGLLYVLMALAAWLVWREGGWRRQGRTLGLFLGQWLLNALWTPLFFGLHRPGLAFAEILLLWVVLAATLLAFHRVNAAAAVLLIPYLVWVSFAAVLNFGFWRLNA